MKEIVGVIDKIAAPADRVWKVIASIGGVDKWAPIITSCRVEGAGLGAKRFCVMVDGTNLEEEVDEIDNAAMRFRYRVTKGLPVEGYQGTVIVKAVDNRNSEVTWYSAYAAPQEMAEGFRQMLREVLPGLIKGLEKHCQN